MFRHLRDIQARRRGEELSESGFTLIELLIVIVVLGILAATVIFALGGVTGQSAVAACNSDAKTVEIAVAAYQASPDNATNSYPTSIDQLVTAPFGGGDTFLKAKPNNSAYTISVGAPNGTVTVTNNATPNNTGVYDSTVAGATNPCTGA